MAEGNPFTGGTILAQVRTPDERVFDLTAADDGVLLTPPVVVGADRRPDLAGANERPASPLAGDPPGNARSSRPAANGSSPRTANCWWSVAERGPGPATAPFRTVTWSARSRRTGTPRDHTRAGCSRARSTGPGSVGPHRHGSPSSTCSPATGWSAPRRQPAPTGHRQRVTVAADRRRPRLRIGRALPALGGHVWDLATGRRVEKLADDRMPPGYVDRSAHDSFGDRGQSRRPHAAPSPSVPVPARRASPCRTAPPTSSCSAPNTPTVARSARRSAPMASTCWPTGTVPNAAKSTYGSCDMTGAGSWLPRTVVAVASAEKLVPLAFTIPGGSAQLLRWLVPVTGSYDEGRALAASACPRRDLGSHRANVGHTRADPRGRRRCGQQRRMAGPVPPLTMLPPCAVPTPSRTGRDMRGIRG